METKTFIKVGKTMKADNRHYHRVDPEGLYHAAAVQWDRIIDAAMANPGLFGSIAEAIDAGHNLSGLLTLAIEAKGAGLTLAQLKDDAHIMARIRTLGGNPEALLKNELNKLIRAAKAASQPVTEAVATNP